jgi:AcrR family transcriptional regulator
MAVANQEESGMRGRGRPRAATAREVQRAAIELFAEHGYSNVSVDDIAMSLGIGRTTYFRYFGSKSGAIWADYEEMLDCLTVALQANGGQLPVMTAIREALLEAVHYDEDARHLNRARLALIAATPELAPERAHISGRFAQIITEYVRGRMQEPLSPVVPDALGYAMVGTMSAVTRMWALAEPMTSYADLLRSAIDAIAIPFQDIIEGRTRP